MISKEPIDVLISFDTTGSMYPCLTQVRARVTDTVDRLFTEIPGLRVAVVAHGDYCDGARAITKLDFTTDRRAVVDFVRRVEATFGGDMPECYELVLHEARSMAWSAGKSKAIVLIGDDVPHSPSDPQNRQRLDWRNELRLLGEAGIHVHAVQALARPHATAFYEEVARISGGCRLELHQFSDVTALLLAVCYRQGAPERLEAFEAEYRRGDGTRAMHDNFETLAGRASKKCFTAKSSRSLEAVHPSRFQVLTVPRDASISDFVQDRGLRFKIGRGFYEFTKSVKVQDHKEVILVDRLTGDMFSGAKAREMLRLPKTGTVSVRPDIARGVLAAYRAFIQSTSANRKLIGGTRFLYEVEDWDR